MKVLQGINTIARAGLDSKMGTDRDQDYAHYARLVAGLHGSTAGASFRPVSQGLAMPVFYAERNPLRPLYTTEDEHLKDLAKSLTRPGSQLND